jgi:hypothetical protein|tara:strand:- start:21 stop:770 length:750 start_codon:yes stop_codon:yes gene_type:complete
MDVYQEKKELKSRLKELESRLKELESKVKDLKSAIKAKRKEVVIKLKDRSIYQMVIDRITDDRPLRELYDAHRATSYHHQNLVVDDPTVLGVELKYNELLGKETYFNTTHNSTSFHNGFSILATMDLFKQAIGTEPVASHYRTFLFIMSYAGTLNLPVDLYGMDIALGIKKPTLSRILWSLSSSDLTEDERKEAATMSDGEDVGTSGQPVIRHGLIRHAKPDKNTDGRRKYVNLTSKGRALAKEISEVL